MHSMDIHVNSVDMDMDMNVKFHINGNPVYYPICLYLAEDNRTQSQQKSSVLDSP